MAKVKVSEALAQATAIGNEIHNRYSLTFVPPEPAGHHQLSVKVRKPSDFQLHARAGY